MPVKFTITNKSETEGLLVEDGVGQTVVAPLQTHEFVTEVYAKAIKFTDAKDIKSTYQKGVAE